MVKLDDVPVLTYCFNIYFDNVIKRGQEKKKQIYKVPRIGLLHRNL
jgi:hypothetical protein